MLTAMTALHGKSVLLVEAADRVTVGLWRRNTERTVACTHISDMKQDNDRLLIATREMIT